MRNPWIISVICICAGFLAMAGCGSDEPQSRNRVPTVQAQLDAAQQAARDAKAAADSAAQTQKNIDAAIDKLDHGSRNSDGSVKIGHAEVSGIGTVTEVGVTETRDGETTKHIFWFTFAERAGFVKKFEIVCPNQAVPVNNTVILNFHWREYESGNPGCYVIDGYTVVK